MNHDKSKKLTTITGQFIYTDNPCTTTPCLPGLAAAILSENELFFITVDGKLLTESRSWNGYIPQLQNQVLIEGFILKNVDLNGKPFYSIEVVSLAPADMLL